MRFSNQNYRNIKEIDRKREDLLLTKRTIGIILEKIF